MVVSAASSNCHSPLSISGAATESSLKPAAMVFPSLGDVKKRKGKRIIDVTAEPQSPALEALLGMGRDYDIRHVTSFHPRGASLPFPARDITHSQFASRSTNMLNPLQAG
jgi:hypothetical protein